MRQFGATFAPVVDLILISSSATTVRHFAGYGEVTVSPLISVAAFVGGLPPGGGGVAVVVAGLGRLSSLGHI